MSPGLQLRHVAPVHGRALPRLEDAHVARVCAAAVAARQPDEVRDGLAGLEGQDPRACAPPPAPSPGCGTRERSARRRRARARPAPARPPRTGSRSPPPPCWRRPARAPASRAARLRKAARAARSPAACGRQWAACVRRSVASTSDALGAKPPAISTSSRTVVVSWRMGYVPGRITAPSTTWPSAGACSCPPPPRTTRRTAAARSRGPPGPTACARVKQDLRAVLRVDKAHQPHACRRRWRESPPPPLATSSSWASVSPAPVLVPPGKVQAAVARPPARPPTGTITASPSRSVGLLATSPVCRKRRRSTRMLGPAVRRSVTLRRTTRSSPSASSTEPPSTSLTRVAADASRMPGSATSPTTNTLKVRTRESASRTSALR